MSRLNVRNWLLMLAATTVLIPFQNCGSGGTLTKSGSGGSSVLSSGSTHAPTGPDLNGSWTGPCEAKNPGSARIMITFTPSVSPASTGTASVIINGYSDAGCVTQMFLDNYTASWALAFSPSTTEAQINFNIAQAQRAPAGTAAAAAFNSNMMCGMTGWTSNMLKNVPANNSCLFFPATSQQLLGLSASGNELYFGNDAQTALDPARRFIK